MEEISFEYWNKLSEQLIFISSLLCGFSLAIIANFLVSEINTKLSRVIMAASVLATSLFLASLFASTNILMMTTNGFPLPKTQADLEMSSIVGGIAFFFGILSLITIISLSGWTKSKNMGRFTTVIGIVTLISILIMVT